MASLSNEDLTARLLALETLVAQLQVALRNVASITTVNNLSLVQEKLIQDLTTRVSNLEANVTTLSNILQ